MSEPKPQHQQDSMDAEARGGQATPGELLSHQRERAGLSHANVGEALHLTVHYIKALENNDYGKLPGLTFVKGYIRAYARFLQMDASAVLSCYEAHLVNMGLEQNSEYGAGSRRRSDQTLLWAVAAAVVLIIALVAGWWFFGRDSGGGTTATGTLPPAQRPLAATGVAAGNNTPETTPAFQVNPLVNAVDIRAENAGETGAGPTVTPDIRAATSLDELVRFSVATSSRDEPAAESTALDLTMENAAASDRPDAVSTEAGQQATAGSEQPR